MLDLSNITKVFYPGTVNEKTALENINLHVNKGDIICVIAQTAVANPLFSISSAGRTPSPMERSFLTRWISLVVQNIAEL